MATPNTSTPPADQGGKKKKTGIMIVSCGTHRRRAGRAFGPEPVEIELKDLSATERAAIENDKVLSVTVID